MLWIPNLPAHRPAKWYFATVSGMPIGRLLGSCSQMWDAWQQKGMRTNLFAPTLVNLCTPNFTHCFSQMKSNVFSQIPWFKGLNQSQLTVSPMTLTMKAESFSAITPSDGELHYIDGLNALGRYMAERLPSDLKEKRLVPIYEQPKQDLLPGDFTRKQGIKKDVLHLVCQFIGVSGWWSFWQDLCNNLWYGSIFVSLI